MNPTYKGYALAAISAASYGVNPVAVFLYDAGYGVDSVLFYRYAFACLFMALLMMWRRESFALTVKELCQLVCMGLLLSASSFTLFESYNHIDVAIASTILFAYPALVTIIMMLLYREKPSVLTVLALVLVAVGILMLNGSGAGGAANTYGVVLVLLSSLSYAIYMVALQKSSLAAMPPLKLTFYSLFFGIFIYVVRLDFCTQLQPLPSSTGLLMCVMALALFPTLVSFVAMAKAIKFIGSTATAILGALEPVTAVLLGIIAFGERPTPTAYAGMGIVILAVTIIITAPRIVSVARKVTRRA